MPTIIKLTTDQRLDLIESTLKDVQASLVELKQLASDTQAAAINAEVAASANA